MSKYFWQGALVKTRFGWIKVRENKEKPLYWYNYEVATDDPASSFAMLPAIEITSEEGMFYIANHFGVGSYKLQKGGWPDVAHFSFNDDAIFVESKGCEEFYKDFDLEAYEEHELKRRKWQARHFPEEFNKNERLRKSIKKDL